ncbi:hypothetical protein CBR_g41653 [Chara braunii]|uniref:Uncharacterized protein n=1 Tax=Chara braunii TaxID=69332 RepID=A0A388LW83_CHABU|nr:hypothetical protein CBR_g41653 [Chara braunii]|eukprot:GBG86588.1 hypothetical protein CBR_g41653 [Chara braunii]
MRRACAELRFAIANNELLPLVRTLNPSFQMKDAELTQLRDRALLAVPGTRHADFELDLRRSQTRELLMLRELFCGVHENHIVPVGETRIVALLRDQIRSLSVYNADLESRMTKFTVALTLRIDRRSVRVAKPLAYCPLDMLLRHAAADGWVMGMCVGDKPKVIQSAMKLGIDMLALDPDSPASVPDCSESRLEPASYDEVEDEIRHGMHFRVARWRVYRQYVVHREFKLTKLLSCGLQEGDWGVKRVHDEIEEGQLRCQRCEDKVNQMRAIIVSGDINEDADHQSEVEILRDDDNGTPSIAEEDTVIDYDVSDIEKEEDFDHKPSTTGGYQHFSSLGSHRSWDPFSICDNVEHNEKVYREYVVDRESKLAKLLSLGFQKGDRGVQRVHVEIEEGQLTRQRREEKVNQMRAIIACGDIDEDAGCQSEEEIPRDDNNDTPSIAKEDIVIDYDVSDIEKEEDFDHKPFTVYRQYVVDRESKLAKLLSRGFKEGDRGVKRVHDQIEEGQLKRQRCEDKVNQMRAIFAYGDIDEDADHQSEEEILRDDDKITPSVAEEDIVTDYDVSDIENHQSEEEVLTDDDNNTPFMAEEDIVTDYDVSDIKKEEDFDHKPSTGFDHSDLQSTVRQLQWVGETLLYLLVQVEVQATLRFVVTESQALSTVDGVEVLYGGLVDQMRAIIASRDIDEDADYQSEEEILRDGDNNTPSIFEEDIVTNYDASDIEDLQSEEEILRDDDNNTPSIAEKDIVTDDDFSDIEKEEDFDHKPSADADHQSEEEILRDNDNDTPSIVKEDIVTNYDVSDIEKEEDFDQTRSAEGDRGVKRVNDRIEKGQLKRQRCEDKVNQMRAIISSGDIDEDVDHQSEEEILRDNDNNTPSIVEEDIVIDYDVSDIEKEDDFDHEPSYDDNRDTNSYTTNSSNDNA